MNARKATHIVTIALLMLCPGLGAIAQPTAVTQSEAQAWERYLIPLPKSINIPYKLDVDPASIAIIAPASSDVMVGQACKELRQTLGLADDAPNPSNPAFTITLVLGGTEADSLSALKNSDQASKVTIDGGYTGLRLIALQPSGLYYAVKSLQQLLAPYVTPTSCRMPLFEMLDWPDMADRGLWGCDHFVWLRWMGDRKLNIGEQISARSVTSDGVGHSSLKAGREPMVTEGPYYGVKPVPVVLHLEQVWSTGLFQYYPQLIGIGGQYGAICYSQPEFVNVLADWICDLRSLPFVEDIDVWMTENLHGDGGCHCAQCSLWDHNVHEASTIVAAWNQAKARMGVPIGLRILTSEETYDSNTEVFAAFPSDVKVWYYHSLYTYTSGRVSMIPTNVANLPANGRYAGVCPMISSVANQPFSSAEFVNYRMTEFVSKNLGGLISYAVPPPLVHFAGYNVEAQAEWSWNLSGRSLHEFAAAMAVRRGYADPEKFAQWADAIGKVTFDLYGSDWPNCEGRAYPGYVAKLLQSGSLPSLGSGSAAWRGPWAEFKTAQQLDDDLALAAKALSLAKDMGIAEHYYESVYADGLMTALRALYKLKGLVVGGTVSSANRETARYYFGVYINSLKQARDAVKAWSVAVDGQYSSVQSTVDKIQRCIDGESGTDNPGMLAVATSCGCTPTLAYNGEPAAKIADAKKMGAGTAVKFYGSVVNSPSTGQCYVQESDRSAGIKVTTSSTTTTGTPVMVVGYVQTAGGELSVNAEIVQAVGSASIVRPVAMTTRSLGGAAFGYQPAVAEYRGSESSPTLTTAQGLNNIGVLVRIAGVVTYVGSDYVYVDDGGKCNDGSGNRGVRVVCTDSAWTKPALWDYVTVTGASSTYSERGSTWRALRASSASNIAPVELPSELVIDEQSAAVTGEWTYTTGSGAYQNDFNYATSSATETATATWRPTIMRPGNYDVYVMYSQGTDRTSSAKYTINYTGGSQDYTVDQTTGGATWQLLGRKAFTVGNAGYVRLTNASADAGKTVVADAVRFVYAGATGTNPPTVTVHPGNVSLCAGATATFTVAATGSGTLSYRWRKGTAEISNGGHYSGATTTTLTVANCDTSDAAANYNCLVTNDFGNTASSNATLTVGVLPAAPTALTPSPVTSDSITWNWGPSTGATSYTLWTAATGGSQIGGTLTTTTYTESALNPGASFSRYVQAASSCGSSARTLLGPTSTTARYCVENGDFESGFTSGVASRWTKGSGTGTFAQETSIVRDGGSSQKLVDASGGDTYTAWMYQKLNVVPSRGYALKVYHRREVSTGAVCHIGISYTGTTTPDLTTDGNGTAGQWLLKTANFTSGATGLVTIMISAGYNGSNTTVYVDGVYLVPQAPSTTGGTTTITNGSSATITASGGFGGTASQLHWYTGPSGTGAHVGTGTSLTVSPTTTTTYYPRWEAYGNCPSSDGAAVTVTVTP